MASRRFRSQIFQAFSRQTLRLGDRMAQTWRQAKLTATWGSQILLYPIYALYQTSRLTSRSIAQAVQRIVPQLQAAPAVDRANPPLDEHTDLDAPSDTPIVRSLIALSGLELSNLTPLLAAADGSIVPAPVAPIVVVDLPGSRSHCEALAPATHDLASRQTNDVEPATVRVRGLACLLSDRRLVLTTIHNQLLDVLTADQQIQLQQRIVWELASYRRLLRLRSTNRSLPLPTDSPQMLPPIRSFQRLMAWMQQSPIAIATNLFGEALLPAAPPDPILPPVAPPYRSASSTPPWAWLGQLFRPADQNSIEPQSEAGTIVLTDAAVLAATRTAVSAQFDRQLATAPSPPSPFAQSSLESSGALSVDAPTTPAAAPTWIETEARLVGYVKHPLEQLLDWLDAGMLWIETSLFHFWRWLSGHPR